MTKSHWELIQKLTSDEADYVTIVAGNPDGDGPNDYVISICGNSTDWKEVSYYGHTTLEALKKAVFERFGTCDHSWKCDQDLITGYRDYCVLCGEERD